MPSNYANVHYIEDQKWNRNTECEPDGVFEIIVFIGKPPESEINNWKGEDDDMNTVRNFKFKCPFQKVIIWEPSNEKQQVNCNSNQKNLKIFRIFHRNLLSAGSYRLVCLRSSDQVVRHERSEAQ